MNKVRNDIILVLSLIFIAVIGIIFLNAFSTKDNLKALVYCEDELILEIDLSKDDEYDIKGKISDIKIRVENNSIQIIESKCNDQTCVHQGKINSTNQTITCLPNQVYIKLVGIKEEVDVII